MSTTAGPLVLEAKMSTGPLLESRPFRPFKSSEEYLYAMKEDLAEWLHTLYPHLGIRVENFMDRLETGVALCEHANAVKVQAAEYVQKKQARKAMSRSATGSLYQAQTLVEIADVKFFATAKPQTFFARDNVSNFIQWCRQSLQILECLLFESDDLILRKNEKHVILCLLEVARRGARFGMLAPMLVQMERQIDREIAADQRAQNSGDSGCCDQDDEDDDSDSEIEDDRLMLRYGPLPQIVTNDLKSLDEMVRDLVAQCTCPTQFPMIRVSEGKYRIGDTKVLIFVRILRNHVMVRVGGGWDTLAHYLDKHDPCRCRAQHRPTTQAARLVNKPGAQDLQGAQVYYERTGPRDPDHHNQHHTPSTTKPSLLNPMTSVDRARSRSPGLLTRRSLSPNVQQRKKSSLAPPTSLTNRSRSPTPNFVSHTKLTMKTNQNHGQVSIDGPRSLDCVQTTPSPSPVKLSKHANAKASSNLISSLQIPLSCKSEAAINVSDHSADHSDNTSEVSDEGYRSLGVVAQGAEKRGSFCSAGGHNNNNNNNNNRSSIYSQNSAEDAELSEHQDPDDIDDTNDFGLRKTHFSEKIYKDNPDVPRYVRPLGPSKRSNSIDSIEVPSSIKSKIPPLSPRRTPTKSNPNPNPTNSIRGSSPRLGRATESFVSPFNRTSPARRSIASFQPVGRKIQSANTSPTKLNLRQELINAANEVRDETKMVEEVHKLLRQYVSQNSLNEFDDIKREGEDKMLGAKGRRDVKRKERLSRIPGPVVAASKGHA